MDDEARPLMRRLASALLPIVKEDLATKRLALLISDEPEYAVSAKPCQRSDFHSTDR